MEIASIKNRSRNFKVGWWILFGIATLSFVNHFLLVFFIPEEAVLFWGWAAFNAYAGIVLLFSYRKLEAWAWIFTWILAAPYAFMIIYDAEIGPYYFAASIAITIAQFLARLDFYRV
jgi:hypothetical protein